VFVVLMLALAFALRGRDYQVEPPELFGRVWTSADVDPAVLFYVTREERSRTLSGVGSPVTYRTVRYDRYALELRRGDDGALLQSLPLGDSKERQEPFAPQVLGIVGDIVWLWREGVEARSLLSLELRCDTARLQAESPEVAAFLPTDPDGFAVMPEPRTFLMRGRDARLYAIDPVGATFAPIAPEELPPSNNTTRAEDRFDYLVAPGRSRITTSPYNLLQRSFLTRTGQWYALLSESEREGLTNWPSAEDRPYGDVARSFYRTDYWMDGNHPAIDPAAVTPVGDARLLQSGFLVRYAGAVWDVPDPSSTLVLAKQLLGEAEPWEVVRLARDGSIVWRASTDLADIGELLDMGTHVVFIGRRVGRGSGAGTSGDTRERIVSIDERTGAKHTLFVATGELAG
jgi:hypothetical protein